MSDDKTSPHIGIYKQAHWVTSVGFKRRWQATLFHMLLNLSTTMHAGRRES